MIPDSGARTAASSPGGDLHPGFWILDSGFWRTDCSELSRGRSASRILDSGFWILACGGERGLMVVAMGHADDDYHIKCGVTLLYNSNATHAYTESVAASRRHTKNIHITRGRMSSRSSFSDHALFSGANRLIQAAGWRAVRTTSRCGSRRLFKLLCS